MAETGERKKKDCYKCPDRTATCHATCGDYLKRWETRNAELDEKVKKNAPIYTAAEERRHFKAIKIYGGK